MRLTVLGAGYVGLVTGACLAEAGHRVAILETDPRRLAPLREGRAPFHEPGLARAVSAATRAGTLEPFGDPAAALSDPDIVLVCVGTPILPDGNSDLSQVQSACAMIAEHAPSAPIAVRSTLPLGSTPLLADWLDRPSLATVVTNPEFLRQGSAVADFLNPSRIVIGTPRGEDTPVARLLLQLYGSPPSPVLITDFNSAEMIKNVANAYLATKLSFINEVADLCETYDADIEAVVAGVGMDSRIGASYFRPGIGFGGSCLPKELANIVRLGNERGLATPLLQGAAQTNDTRPVRIANRLEALLGAVAGCRIALLGLAFKPNTDDLRYSPAIALGKVLANRGASVIGHDEAVGKSRTEHLPWLQRASSGEDAVRKADLVILATEWPTYAQLDWAALASEARRPILFDGRNALDRPALEHAGWRVISVGRSEAVRPAEVRP